LTILHLLIFFLLLLLLRRIVDGGGAGGINYDLLMKMFFAGWNYTEMALMVPATAHAGH